MKFKTLLTVNSILAFTSGVVCILVPVQLLAHYDVSLSPMGLVVYQFWGAALVGLGMLVWFARGIVDSSLQWKISLALFITNTLSCVMTFRGQYSGANARGWSMVVLFGIFTLAYAVFTIIKLKNASPESERPT